MHRAFDVKSMCCRALFNVLRERPNVLRNIIINTLEVLRHTSFSQRVAKILLTTQRRSGRRNTATLLSLKYLYICMCTYMHMCIGVSKERHSKCCAPRLSGSDIGFSLAGVR